MSRISTGEDAAGTMKGIHASWRRRLLIVATVGLSALAVAYLGNGFHTLIFGDANDLQKRWLEQTYVASGIDPYEGFDAKPEVIERLGQREEHLPRMHAGGYPPWAFLTGFAFTPPLAFNTLKVYFALVNAVCLALIAGWAYSVGRRLGGLEAAFLTSATLAIFSSAIALRLGNYGVVITALLAGMLILESRGVRWRGVQGIVLGLAALKPNISAPFGLALLVRRRWLGVTLCVSYIVAASAVVWWLVGSDPLTMLESMYDQSGKWEAGDSGVIGLLLDAGLSRGIVTGTALILGSLCASAVAWYSRECPLFVTFALISPFARLWMYHRRYDDTMLVFLLVALAWLAFKRPRTINVGVFVLVGLSLWLPHREADQTTWLIFLRVSCWLAGTLTLLTEIGRGRVGVFWGENPALQPAGSGFTK